MKPLTSNLEVIFNADDFGVCYGVNEGIVECAKNGVLTSASIRTNGIAFDDAVILGKKYIKKIGIGLHLNLTDGRPHTDTLKSTTGVYKYTFFTYSLELMKDRGYLKDAIAKELEVQFKIAKYKQLDIDHVDGQDHIHMIPSVFDIVCKLCKQYHVDKIRLPSEPYYIPISISTFANSFYTLGIGKRVLLNYLSQKNKITLLRNNMLHTDAFYGVLYTNNMTTKNILQALADAKSKNYRLIEIASHPARLHHPKDSHYTSSFFARYANMPNRKYELESLCSDNLKTYLKKNNISITSYKNLKK